MKFHTFLMQESYQVRKDKGMEHSANKVFSWDDHFFGAVTVGERGQVVIPADARKRFDIAPGDKLLIMSDPGKRALMLCKMDSLREFMSAFQEGLARFERDMDTGADTVTPQEEDER